MKQGPIKFVANQIVWRRLEAQARHWSIGANEPSVGDVARIIVSQFSLVPPKDLFQALAAVEPFQRPAEPDAPEHKQTTNSAPPRGKV